MNPQNILVRLPNWVGDLVMATPVLLDLKRYFPKAQLTAMCCTPICQLLQTEGSIDELYCFTRPQSGFLRRQEQRDIIAKIAAGKYDLGILLTNSFSSAWWFWQGKVERRIGYRGNWRSWLLTDPVKRSAEKMHQVDAYKRLLEPLGIAQSDTAPRLCVSAEEVQESKQLLFQRGYAAGKKLIGINAGAAFGSAKRWPPERFRELAQKLLEDEELFLLFFGDMASMALIRQICQGLPERAMNLAGVTSLRELVSLIQDCDLLITNDSGPMHIAAAVQTPLIALFGSTDEEATGPYGQIEAVIRKNVACSPCFKRECPIDFRCMKGISVDEVVEKARSLLIKG